MRARGCAREALTQGPQSRRIDVVQLRENLIGVLTPRVIANIKAAPDDLTETSVAALRELSGMELTPDELATVINIAKPQNTLRAGDLPMLSLEKHEHVLVVRTPKKVFMKYVHKK